MRRHRRARCEACGAPVQQDDMESHLRERCRRAVVGPSPAYIRARAQAHADEGCRVLDAEDAEPARLKQLRKEVADLDAQIAKLKGR